MRGSREISLVPSLHRASTDALIHVFVVNIVKNNILVGNQLAVPSCGY